MVKVSPAPIVLAAVKAVVVVRSVRVNVQALGTTPEFSVNV
jgi:hypothetical protein